MGLVGRAARREGHQGQSQGKLQEPEHGTKNNWKTLRTGAAAMSSGRQTERRGRREGGPGLVRLENWVISISSEEQ